MVSTHHLFVFLDPEKPISELLQNKRICLPSNEYNLLPVAERLMQYGTDKILLVFGGSDMPILYAPQVRRVSGHLRF